MPAKSFLSLTQSYRFAVGGSRVMKETVVATLTIERKLERKRNGTIMDAKRNVNGTINGIFKLTRTEITFPIL